MKKYIIILLSILILFSFVGCKRTYNISELQLIVNGGYKLQKQNEEIIAFDKNENIVAAILITDEMSWFNIFKDIVANHKDILEVYDNTDTYIYYSCKNDEGLDFTEYNRVIKVSDNRMVIIAGYDKTMVDDFYSKLTIKQV